MPVENRGRESLKEIAALALEFGRLVMEAGSSVRHVDEIAERVAVGLGAERFDLRVGYGSLAITISIGTDEVTRIRRVGPLGVNESLHRELSMAAARIGHGGFTIPEARAELTRLLHNSSRYPDWVVAVGVGIACAAFGRLLGVDWAGVGPIFVTSALGQTIRRQLALHNVNVFISAAAVAFLGSLLCQLGAQCAGSHFVATDMIATVLLLVPGVPAFNAQYDLLDGRPALGAARALWAIVVLVFMTAGVWLAQSLFGARP